MISHISTSISKDLNWFTAQLTKWNIFVNQSLLPVDFLIIPQQSFCLLICPVSFMFMNRRESFPSFFCLKNEGVDNDCAYNYNPPKLKFFNGKDI